MELVLYGSISVILFLLIVLISLTFLSGIYPATVLSRYNPIKALRYKLKIGRKKSFSLYNILVVFQFFISQVLIVSAIVISLQMNFFKNKDLGFDKENIILVDVPQYQSDKAQILAEILRKNPNVEKVSLGIGAPMSGSNINSSMRIPGDENYYQANVKTVDSIYHKLYDLEFLAGEWYKSPKMNDSTFNIVVSKSLVKSIGIEKPVDAIDTYIKVFGSIHGRVVGVVDDFHAYSLKHDIAPVLFIDFADFFVKMSIKTNGISYSEISTFIENSWNEVLPEYIYNYEFLEETIDASYESEQRVFDIIMIFTFIAIVVACLGLYGLVSFMLMQRTKEVGIRKALGATVTTLVMLVSKQFLKLVLISCVLAWPVAYYLMNKWLQNYAYKIELNLWIFIVSGIILVTITFLTVFYQSIKVSLTNPVDVLKYE
jgi:ABC-type antimicrobial peptide transport system permease subunit